MSRVASKNAATKNVAAKDVATKNARTKNAGTKNAATKDAATTGRMAGFLVGAGFWMVGHFQNDSGRVCHHLIFTCLRSVKCCRSFKGEFP